MTDKPRRASTRLAKVKLDEFFHHLGRTGSVTLAAERSGLRRPTLYKLRANDDWIATRWQRALDLGVERLQDDAMRRALDGVERPVWRNGEQVGTVQQYDNRLLQFLLRSHRPEIYGDRKQAGPPPLPFDLAKRLAAGQRRADAYQSRRRAGQRSVQENQEKSAGEKQRGQSNKQGS
ncbi:MAG: hypothetical protein HYZ40_02405 [Rhodospirillales bacterium]|nr:hypothetical protein [Rhodospirillales bacterium]